MTIRTTTVAILAGCAAIGVGYHVSNQAMAENQAAAAAPSAIVLPAGASLSELALQTPDGSDIVALYKSAETVAAVQDANVGVEAEITKASAVVRNVAGFQTTLMTACDDKVDLGPTTQIVAKTNSLAATVALIRNEVTRSFAAMRKAVESDRAASEQAKDAVDQYLIATHRLGQLTVQARELAKTAEGLGASIARTAAESCHPPRIPRLFAHGSSAELNPAPVSVEMPNRPISRTPPQKNGKRASRINRPLRLFTCERQGCQFD